MAHRIPLGTTSPAASIVGTTDPIQLRAQAHNALNMALHYLRQPRLDVQGAHRKVAEAKAALRRLDMAMSMEG